MRAGSLACAFVEAFLPSLCLRCDAVLPGTARGLCGRCWSAVLPRFGATCSACGGPTDEEGEPCSACATSAPPQAATLVWGEHDGALRDAILALKHGGHDELARPLGERLATSVAWSPAATGVQLVTSVPSHPLRRLRRGWAASELLGREVARRLGLPYRRTLRRRGLATQTGRSRAQRLRLPASTFTCRHRLDGTRLLVVDDVTTTGATLRTAATCLRAAGADIVVCAALAAAPDLRRST